MAVANRGRSPLPIRALGVSMLFLLTASLAVGTGAGAVTKKQLERAEAEYLGLQDDIADKQKELALLGRQANALSQRILEASAEFDAIVAELTTIRERLEVVTARYQERVQLLEDRARAAFVQGGGSNLEFLLGAGSLSDLNDRLQFVQQIAEADADIAAEVQSLRNQLEDDEAEQTRLKERQRRVIDSLAADRQALEAKWDQQLAIVEALKAARAEAKEHLEKLEKRRRRELAAQYGLKVSDGVFKVCPVGQPHGFGDDFGAPRYGGGYHLHKGNDIFAPAGTEIHATFDGTAVDARNTLGGNAVKVIGAQGYTYNAHLSRYGKLGPVTAGDVIGYVGNTGDALGTPPHNHFEWHPNVAPSDWPASGYGYSVIDDAVNPNPLLLQVC